MPMAAVPAQSMERNHSCQQHRARHRVSTAPGAGWGSCAGAVGAAGLFPVHVEEGRTFFQRVWLIWLHQCSCGVKGCLCLLGTRTQTLQKGLWAPGACIFETESFPAGPGVLHFLENLNKEVVFGLTNLPSGSFCRCFISLCTGCQGAPELMGIPKVVCFRECTQQRWKLPLGHVPALLWNTQRSAGSLWGGNTFTCSQGLLESLRLWEWDSGWPQQPTGSVAGAPTVHYPPSHSCRCWVVST